MNDNGRPEPRWAPRFLEALARTGCARQAAREAQVNRGSVYHRKRTNPQFADKWQAALVIAEADKYRPEEPPRVDGPPCTNWRTRFIEGLAETSNVKASAARANVPIRRVYKLRRDDPGFAARWLSALHEGYDHLEMELLGYLRDPHPTGKMEVSGALRLLAAHRETVERRRAMMAEEDDEQAMLDSLDTFLAQMRERRFANEAILIEEKNRDGAE